MEGIPRIMIRQAIISQLTQLARKYTSSLKLCANGISQLDLYPCTTEKCIFLFLILPNEKHNLVQHLLSKMCAQKRI